MAARSAVVVGATGLVGGRLVRTLSSDPSVGRVLAPVRRPVSWLDGLPRVEAPEVDFGELAARPEAFRGDQVFLCLGTTMKKAGSREAFRRVDFDATLEAARAALGQGAQDAFLVSSVGADPGSRAFYLRVKGEVEEAIAGLGFRSTHAFRPAILKGERAESRPGERAALALLGVLGPLLVGPLRRQRPISADTVARAMARQARDPGQARRVYESEEIAELGV